ncbi:MAG: type II toxin-antitoxin system Phd/YefM family antitoxin [Candidatus Aureabacteria bacterium]|nr:type II toxin-antitoxin system Phd/YefM family antitoxin [Candidatus Auribacterota bacterium]
MKQVALAKVKDHFSRYLIQAGKEKIIITKHGKPAGVLIGFEDEDDWFDFRLENDPRFLKKVEESRASIHAGKGIPWEQIKDEDDQRTSASTVRETRRRFSRR